MQIDQCPQSYHQNNNPERDKGLKIEIKLKTKIFHNITKCYYVVPGGA